MEKRRSCPITKKDCYVEKHHIIPKSEGGADDDENLVNLTAREHFIAHLLLARIYDDQKMWCALKRMCYGAEHVQRDYHISSHTYEMMRKHLSERLSEYLKVNPPFGGRHHTEENKKHLSEIGKTLTGERNPFYGRRHSEETKEKLRQAHIGKKASEETKAKLREKRKGKKPALGKHLSPETRAKVGEGCRRAYANMTPEERRAKLGVCKGRFWFNDGEREVKAYTCPDGFTRGRLRRCRKH